MLVVDTFVLKQVWIDMTERHNAPFSISDRGLSTATVFTTENTEDNGSAKHAKGAHMINYLT